MFEKPICAKMANYLKRYGTPAKLVAVVHRVGHSVGGLQERLETTRDGGDSTETS